VAELVVRSRAERGTSVGSVRFGNVLGSRGSFLHVLAHQVAMRAPVTITDPEVDRFFMTVEEAVGLVLEAGAMAEEGETFALDMGEPVRLVSLVEAYAAQVGATDVQLQFTGLRPGEKLNEELFSAKEAPIPTAHPRISATRGDGLPDQIDAQVGALAEAAARNDRQELMRLLTSLVPEYTPSEPPAAPAPTWFDSLYPDDF
jgi:FlaA1/EpsC-like NDP-sugar epimerase